MRRVEFQIGEYYHVFNRGVEKREIFCSQYDYIRFIRGMREFNRVEAIGSLYEKEYQDNKAKESMSFKNFAERGKEVEPPIGGSTSESIDRLVKIVCYCLIPNHYHFIFQQLVEHGIEKYMQRIGTGYTLFFNNKYNRSGSLFQGKYKYVHIKSNENLLRLSSYINGNSEVHGICQAEKWRWGSYQDYLNIRQGDMCNKEDILEQFKNVKEYFEFSDYIIKGSKETKSELKKYYLE